MSTIVTFNGNQYTLTDDVVLSSRLLPYPRNYHEVDFGEEYDFEMIAKAVGQDGQKYMVSWIFTNIKGDECDLDNYDYQNVTDIIPI